MQSSKLSSASTIETGQRTPLAKTGGQGPGSRRPGQISGDNRGKQPGKLVGRNDVVAPQTVIVQSPRTNNGHDEKEIRDHRELLTTGVVGQQKRVCKICGQLGHLASACSYRLKCRVCGNPAKGWGVLCRCTPVDIEKHAAELRMCIAVGASLASGPKTECPECKSIKCVCPPACAKCRRIGSDCACAAVAPVSVADVVVEAVSVKVEATPLLKAHYDKTTAVMGEHIVKVDGWCAKTEIKTYPVYQRAVDAVAAAVSMLPRAGPGYAATWAVAKATSLKMHQNVVGIADADVSMSILAAAAAGFHRDMRAEVDVLAQMHATVVKDGLHLEHAAVLVNPTDVAVALARARGQLRRQRLSWCVALLIFLIATVVPPLAWAGVGLAVPYVLDLKPGGETWQPRTPSKPSTHSQHDPRRAMRMKYSTVSVVEQRFNEHHYATPLNDPMIYHDKLNLDRVHPILPTKLEFAVGELSVAKSRTLDHFALAAASSLPVVAHSDGLGEANGIARRVFGNKIIAKGDSLSAFRLFLREFLDFSLPLPPCVICSLYGDRPDAHAQCYADWNSTDRVSSKVAFKHNAALADVKCGLERRHHTRCGFVKVELNTGKALATEYDPLDERIIQDVDARVHVTLGPYMYAFSKHIAKLWHSGNWLCYASGITTEEAGQFVEPGNVYYVGDLSRFDRSIHAHTLFSLNEWRAQQIHLSRDVRKCLAAQLKTCGTTLKGRHHYKVDGQRKSGDDNTSCDNTVLNAAAHAWAICNHTGLTLAELSRDYKIIALGDDILVSGPDALKDVPFGSLLQTIGWSPKPRVEYDVNGVDFCSRIPWPSTNGVKFACRPGRALSRFPFSAENPCPVSLGTKAYGLYLDNAHVPFFRRYLERCLVLDPVRAAVRTHEWQFRPSTSVSIAKPVPATWAMLYDLYGLTQADEDAYALTLESWAGGPAVYDDPYLNHIFTVEKIGGMCC